MAGVVTMDPSVEKVIGTTVTGTMSALQSAAKEPSVKRFVLTSSAGAVRDMDKHFPERPISVDEFNEDAIEAVKNLPDSLTDAERGHIAYIASKTISEKRAWEWVNETKPHFAFSTGK